MLMLVLGLVLFLGAHSLRIVAPAARARLGEGPGKGLVAIVSLVGLVLIVWGYGAAREAPVVLWDPPVWTRHLAALLMVVAFPLLFAAYLPGRIKARLKHPMLAAVKLWAVAHLLANGTLADVVLFGSVLAWAVVDRISLKRRGVMPAGAPGERAMANDAIAVVAGLAVYVAFLFWLHQALIGVSPIG